MLEILVPGEAVPKYRPRFGFGKKVYTPQKTKDYEKLVGYCANGSISKQKGEYPLKGSVSVYIDFYFKPLPKQPKDILNALKCIWLRSGRGDVDNYAKIILDGMNEIVYEDDEQVNHLSISICDFIEKPKLELPYAHIFVQKSNKITSHKFEFLSDTNGSKNEINSIL